MKREYIISLGGKNGIVLLCIPANLCMHKIILFPENPTTVFLELLWLGILLTYFLVRVSTVAPTGCCRHSSVPVQKAVQAQTVFAQ